MWYLLDLIFCIDCKTIALMMFFIFVYERNNIKEIAIPAISTGVFGFPKDEAAKIAVKTVIENQDGFEKIIFAVYEEKDKEYYERELEKVKRNNK